MTRQLIPCISRNRRAADGGRRIPLPNLSAISDTCIGATASLSKIVDVHTIFRGSFTCAHYILTSRVPDAYGCLRFGGSSQVSAEPSPDGFEGC